LARFFSILEHQLNKIMKKGRFLMLVGFLAINSFADAQNYTFRVLANKGANEIKTGENWQPVKTGSILNASDELKITENASIGLVHVKGKPLEVKQAGIYKVADLASKVSAESSVLNKYTDFMLSRNSAEEKKNRLSATGAVHRGGTGAIHVLLPGNQDSRVFGNEVYINWESTEKGPYTLSLLDMFDMVLMKIETPENSVVIDLNDPKFADTPAIIIEVKSKTTGAKTDESSRPMFKRLSAADKEKFTSGYNELMKEIPGNTAFDKLFLAGFFEQNKLLIDAISAYETAIKLAPDDPTYKEYYEEFLYRNRIKEEKK